MKRRNAPCPIKPPSSMRIDHSIKGTTNYTSNYGLRTPTSWGIGSKRNLLERVGVGSKRHLLEGLGVGSKRHLLEPRRALQAVPKQDRPPSTSSNQLALSPPSRPQPRYPTARDGHAAIVYFGCLWIFGGDRHHMPFNDLQILPLAQFLS